MALRGRRTSLAATGRICIVRQTAYYELPLRREAEALRDAGYSVDVVCMREAGGPALEVVDGVTLHRLPVSRRRGSTWNYLTDYFAFFARAAVAVTRLHLRERFVAIQVNTMPDLLVFTALVPRLLGARVVAFMNEPTPELGTTKYGSPLLTRLLTVVEKMALRFADLAFTVTDQHKARYVARGARAEKIHVVLNGPDGRHLLQHRTGTEPDGAWFTAVCHGLIDERYGHGTMVRAIRLAADRLPNLRLWITGNGPYIDEMQRLIKAEGVEDRVQYLGWLQVRDLVDVLSRSDVGIVAQESSPYSNLVHTNKMYEYMLFGKPVIASRLDSTARYFPDDSVQYFEPGSPQSLADALVALHDDPRRQRVMVQRATELCRSYGWPAQKEIYLAAYAALLGGSPAREPVPAAAG